MSGLSEQGGAAPDSQGFPHAPLEPGAGPWKTAVSTHVACQLEAPIVHLKQGEPDLSIAERTSVVLGILQRSPATFLQRWGSYVAAPLLKYFDQYEDYAVQFHLNRLRKSKLPGALQALARNRRYAKLQQLRDEGDFFSELEMQRRDPLLYQEYIGDHLSEAEVQERSDAIGGDRWSSQLMSMMLASQTRSCMRDQIELEESQMEEEEDEEEAEEEPVRKPIPLTDIQKDQLRLEHLRIMEERFLQGKEPSVDYVAIDDNAELDDLGPRDQDLEEAYFDDDGGYEAPQCVDGPSTPEPPASLAERLRTRAIAALDASSDPAPVPMEGVQDSVEGYDY